MKRVVRLGARLFSFEFITRRSLERAIAYPDLVDMYSSVTTFCVEW